jgi:putative permease
MTEAPRSLRRMAGDPQILSLLAVIALGAGALWAVGFELIPFLAAFALAYFLDAGVQWLARRGFRRGVAVGLVYVAFLVGYVGLLVGPVQHMARRGVELAQRLPGSSSELIQHVQALPDPTFGLLPASLRQDAVDFLLARTQEAVSAAVTGTLGLVPQVTSWVVFVLVVPLLVFFFLKDKEALMRGVARCLPRRRELLERIWLEMEQQLGNYVRGKIWEILIVGVVSWLAFALLGFGYPVVFGALSGLSVVVPFVGMIGVAVPLFILGLLQWGLSWALGWLLIAYAVIQFVDGNIVAPYIFSETVKLHPLVILLAVFVFGGLWGFWGVLFAIPLATFAKALLSAYLDLRDQIGEAAPDTAGAAPGADGLQDARRP